MQDAEQEARKTAQKHAENVDEIVDGMSKKLRDAQDRSAQQVMSIVDQGMKNFHGEINRVAQEWGRNLVAVAEKAQQAIDAIEAEQE